MNNRPLDGRSDDGFTLIETMLAIAIASILATTATPIFIDVSRQSQIASEDAVTGNVRTGITLTQMQNVVQTGIPNFPAVLDGAPTGIVANGATPFFANVLNSGVTSGWQKEAALSYRSPTGRLFIYDPGDGSFTDKAEIPDSENNNASLGKIIFEYAGIAFYDTGAIIDTTSDLAYVPSLLGDQVTLTLLGGTQISTHDDGSASITLDNGDLLNVANTHTPSFFNLSPKKQEPNQHSYDYLFIDNGQASEESHSTRFTKKEYKADGKQGSFNYEYDIDGSYSGGSLKKEVGYIYKTKYTSPSEQSSSGAWNKKENGNIEGTTKHTYQYDSDSRYGYNHPDAKFRYAFKQTAETSGTEETSYVYDKKKDTYTTELKGKREYQLDHDSSTGQRKSEEGYEYDGASEYDKKNGNYKSKMNYHHKDGRDLTYEYERNEKTKIYEWSVIDNKTGKKTTQTNKPKEDKDKDKDEKDSEEDD